MIYHQITEQLVLMVVRGILLVVVLDTYIQTLQNQVDMVVEEHQPDLIRHLAFKALTTPEVVEVEVVRIHLVVEMAVLVSLLLDIPNNISRI